MPRKTADLQALVDTANGMLAYPGHNPEFRQGVCTLLEQAMLDAGNYGGYSYLTQADLPKGDKPGVRNGPNGELLSYTDRFADTDNTRRHYSLKKVS